MNLLKSLFLCSFILLAMASASFSGWAIYRGWPPLAWGGVLLAVGPFLLLIGRFLAWGNPGRSGARFSFLNLSGAAGCGLAAWGWHERQASILAPGLAMIGWLGVVLCVYWYSSKAREPIGKTGVADKP